MKFIIVGRTPSKKNSKRIVVVRGRPLVISSKDYMDWHEKASWDLVEQKMVIQQWKIKFPLKNQKVKLTFFAGDKRKFDLSNKAESIMDLLVDNEILLDDNYEIVPELILKFGGLDKANPRAEIIIEKI